MDLTHENLTNMALTDEERIFITCWGGNKMELNNEELTLIGAGLLTLNLGWVLELQREECNAESRERGVQIINDTNALIKRLSIIKDTDALINRLSSEGERDVHE